MSDEYAVIEAIEIAAQEWAKSQRGSRPESSHRVAMKHQRAIKRAGFAGTFTELWREVYEAGMDILTA